MIKHNVILFLSIACILTFTGLCACKGKQTQTLHKQKSTSKRSVVKKKNAHTSSRSKQIIPVYDNTPKWLIDDLKIASKAHFPMSAQTYALNWNARSYANNYKGFNVAKDTKHLWIGGYTGTIKQQKYSFYSLGPDYKMKKLYGKVKTNAFRIAQAKFIYMLEYNAKTGIGHLTPAMSIHLGNGQLLAFAENQVITKSVHAGMDQYAVYPIKGIKLPNQSK